MRLHWGFVVSSSDDSPSFDCRLVCYRVGQVILLYLGMQAVGLVVWTQRARYSRLCGNAIYISVALYLGIVLFVSLNRPRLLACSQWRPHLRHVMVGLACGSLIKACEMLFISDPVTFLSPPYLPAHSLMPIAFLGSTLEEIVFRGVFLRSLEVHLSKLAALSIIVLLAGMAHGNFWFSIPMQLLFCVLYLTMGNSRAASICAHVASNTLLYIPGVGLVFERLHLFTIWRLP